MHSYTYEIKEKGYVILDNGRAYMVQEEPFIPNPALSYEENAIQQIKELEEQQNQEDISMELLQQMRADMDYMAMETGITL